MRQLSSSIVLSFFLGLPLLATSACSGPADTEDTEPESTDEAALIASQVVSGPEQRLEDGGDPFDPSVCASPAMSHEDAVSLFEPAATAVFLGGLKVYARSRACSAVTGCGPWAGAARIDIPLASAGHHVLRTRFPLGAGLRLSVRGSNIVPWLETAKNARVYSSSGQTSDIFWTAGPQLLAISGCNAVGAPPTDGPSPTRCDRGSARPLDKSALIGFGPWKGVIGKDCVSLQTGRTDTRLQTQLAIVGKLPAP